MELEAVACIPIHKAYAGIVRPHVQVYGHLELICHMDELLEESGGYPLTSGGFLDVDGMDGEGREAVDLTLAYIVGEGWGLGDSGSDLQVHEGDHIK